MTEPEFTNPALTLATLLNSTWAEGTEETEMLAEMDEADRAMTPEQLQASIQDYIDSLNLAVAPAVLIEAVELLNSWQEAGTPELLVYGDSTVTAKLLGPPTVVPEMATPGYDPDGNMRSASFDPEARIWH